MLKRKSLFLSLLLALVMSFTAFFISQKIKTVNASTSETVAFADDIMDFSIERPYAVSQNLTAVPKTFEVLINVNTMTKLSNGRWGVVMGNYLNDTAYNNDCFNIAIEANGHPSFYWYNPNSNTTNSNGENVGFYWVVSEVSLNTAEWNHIAFVRDTVNDKTYFYLNGILTATYNNAGDDMIPGSWGSGCGAIKIGMDSKDRSYLIDKFQGKIAYASVSATTKSAVQIADSMNKMKNGTITQGDNATALNTVVYNTSKSYYRPTSDFNSTPNTITATIKIPEGYNIVKGGTIIGNYANGASNQSFNLDVLDNGHLYLVWNKSKQGDDYSSAELRYEFTSTDLRNGEWTNIALVRDKTENQFKLYINGELVEVASYGVGADIVGTYSPTLGSDFSYAGSERNIFVGKIKDCAVFSTALNQSQIDNFYNTADKTTVSKENYPSMMMSWVLSDTQSTLYYVSGDREGLIDYSGNENHAVLCTSQHYYDPPKADENGNEWFTAQDDEYTIILMPDTQCTMEYDIGNYFAYPELYNSVADFDMTKTFQWMVDNADAMNLSFVLHGGDVKQSRGVSNDWDWDGANNESVLYDGKYYSVGDLYENDWREWQLMSGYTSINEDFQTKGATATNMAPNIGFTSEFVNGQSYGFGLLRDAGIPYSVILGNHDYNNFSMDIGSGRHADYYNYYFSSQMYDEAFPGTVVSRYSNNTPEFAKNNDTMMNVIYEMDATPKGSSTPIKYLVVSFEFGPDDDMLAWANEVVSRPEFSSHRVITTTHAMNYLDGEYMAEESAFCNPVEYGWVNSEGILGANNGKQIFDKFVTKHGNSFFTTGGHVAHESLADRTDVGDYGNTIYSLLVDFQCMYSSTGDSLIVVAKVNESTKKITFKTYNPVTNKFYNLENEIEYDFSGWEADTHTVTWKNGETTLETDNNIAFGSTPTYNGTTPTSSNGTFVGWATNPNGTPVAQKDLPKVTADATYYAIFAQSNNTYTITWSVNGKTTTSTVKGGELPVFTGSTYKFGYEFVGWDKVLSPATTNTTYTAVYSDTSVWDGKYPTGGVIEDYLSGSGTQASPYLIESASDLAALSYFSWGKAYGSGLYFKQTINLDMTNGIWIGICDADGQVGNWVNVDVTTYGFNGVYDGNGKSINLIQKRIDNFGGLFWAIKDGTVKNLTLNGTIIMGSYSGALVARISGSATISGIRSNVELTKSASVDVNACIGIIGFVAQGVSGTVNITDCVNNGEIKGVGRFVAGIIGSVYAPTSLTLNITNCHNNGNITGTDYSAGLIGMVSSGTTCKVDNCSNTGSVVGNNYVGGLVGNCNWNVNMAITNSSNSGAVTANNSNVGGIIAYLHKGGEYINNTIGNCTSTGIVKVANQEVTSKYGQRDIYGGKYIGKYDGYVNVQWSVNGTIAQTSTIYPGGAPNGTNSVYPIYNGATPTKSGYSFVGWSLTEGGEVIYGNLPYPVEDTTTFYAVFVANTSSTLSVWDGTYPTVTAGSEASLFEGEGTEESPYLIQSAKDLATLSALSWGKAYGSVLFFKQTVDINLGTHAWIGICDNNGAVDGWVNVDDTTYGFDGVYDGNGKSITINQSSGNNFAGIFWAIRNGKVKNLVLNGSITAGSYSGTLTARVCGSATISGITNNITLTKDSASTDNNNFFGMIGFITKGIAATINISDCINNGDMVTSGNHTGGIVGGVYEGATALVLYITNCSNSGEISGKAYVGGIISKVTANTTCIINGCVNTGKIVGAGNYAGGIIGFSLANSTNTVTNCINQASVSAVIYAAGIVGGCNWNVNMNITDCENSGAITGNAYVAGITAYVHKGGNYSGNKVENCTSNGKIKVNGLVVKAKYGKVETYGGNIIGRFDGYVNVQWSVNGTIAQTSTIYPGGAPNGNNSIYPVYTGAVPTKAEENGYIYTFAGWSLTENGSAIVGDLPFVMEDTTTFYAVFTATAKTYTITWIVDGVSTTTSVAYGEMPNYNGVPTKEADSQYTYTFAGWSPNLVEVVEDATYTAIFDRTEIIPEDSSSSSSSSSSEDISSSSSSIEESSSSVSSSQTSSSMTSESSSEETSSSSSSSSVVVPEQSSSSSSSKKKGGCGSNIGHSSIILSMLAVVSCLVIVSKKKN